MNDQLARLAARAAKTHPSAIRPSTRTALALRRTFTVFMVMVFMARFLVAAPAAHALVGAVANDDSYAAQKNVVLTVSPPGVLANDTGAGPLTAALVTGPVHGFVSFHANGGFVYTPDHGYTGTDTFTYTANDGFSTSTPGTVTITTTNTAPVAADDSLTVAENAGATNIDVMANDSDINGDSFHFASVFQPLHGTVAVVGSGVSATLDYTPDAEYSGPDNFTYTITDGNLTSAPATVSVQVNGVNDVPSFTAGSDQTVGEDSGANTVAGWATALSKGDANDAGQALDFIVTNNNNSLFSVQPDINAAGDLTYTIAPNHSGAATVSAKIHDNGGTANGGVDTSAAQTFTITSTFVNDAPSFAGSGNISGLEDSGANTVAGWASAISPGAGANEADQSVAFTVNNDNNALFSVQPAIDATTGDLTYTLNPNVSGVVNITATLTDNGGTANGGVDTSAPQTFTLTVTSVNDVPSFTPGADQSALEDSGLNTVAGWATAMAPGVGANEAGQVLSFNVSNDNNALFSVQPAIDATTGDLTYTLAGNMSGSATVTVSLSDNGGTANGGIDTSAPSTFTITAAFVNDAPSFTPGANQTVNEDSGANTAAGWASAITPGAGSNEAEQSVNFVIWNDNNAMFSVQPSVDPISGDLTYTVAPNATGTANVSVYIADNGGTANGGQESGFIQPFTISVSPVADPPVCSNDSASVLEDGSVSGTVASDCSTTDGNAIAYALNTDGTNGTAVVNADGTYTYTPAANYSGADSFTVTATESGGDAATFTVNVNVTWVNDVPSFTAGSNVSAGEDSGANTVAGWATAMSPGVGANEVGQTLNFNVSNDNNSLFSVQPAIDPVTGDLNYTIAPDQFGAANVTVSISDNGGTANGGVDTSATQTFTITSVWDQDPPVAVNDSVTVNEDAGVTAIPVLANDSDPDGDALTVVSVTGASHGDVTIPVGGGSVNYLPFAGYSGPDSFTYTISDGVTTSTATVNVTVAFVNDVPGFTKGSDQSVNEDSGAATVNGWATAITPGTGANEAGQVTWFNVSNDNNALFAVQPNVDSTGNLTYTLADNMSGSATVSVSISDNGGTANGGIDTSTVQTFTITANAVNDVPSFTVGADQIVSEDSGASTVSGWATAMSDGIGESGQTLSFNVSNNNPDVFSVQPSVDPISGDLTYTVAPNATGTVTVSVSISDNGGTANGGVDTSATQTFTISVSPVSDPPACFSAETSVLEDGSLSDSVAGNCSTTDGNAITYALNTDGSNGSAVVNADGTYTYTPNANYSGPDSFTVTATESGGDADTFTVYIWVTAVNDVPSFTGGPDQTILEDSGAQTVNGWATAISPGVGSNESGQSTVFNVSNDNNSLFSVQPAIDTAGNLTYALAPNMSGSATVTVSISDNGGTDNGGVDTSAAQTFVITSTFVNDAPSFTGGSDQTVNEDAGYQSVEGWASAITPGTGFNEGDQSVSFNVSNDNNALFDVQPSIDPWGNLSYTLAPNTAGSATVTVSLSDNGGTANGGVDTSATQTFVITANFVNDIPTFTAGSDQTVNEDSGAQTVSGWAADMSPGVGSNEAGQSVSFNVSNDNNALFSVQPAIDPISGDLTYTLADAMSGAATVSVTLQDNAGIDNDGIDTSVTKTFVINATFVNDAPSFLGGSNTTSVEDAGAQTVSGWATGMNPGAGSNEADQALTFNVSNNDNELFSVQPSVDPISGDLTYTGAPGANGSATVTVSLSDNGGTANGGVDTSATQTFVITLTPDNEPPTAVADTGSVNENAAATDFNVLANDSDAESEALSVTAASIVSPEGAGTVSVVGNMVHFTPAHLFSGTVTIDYTVSDAHGSSTGVLTVTVIADTTAPTMTPPTQSFIVPSTVGLASAPVRLSWAAASDISGIAGYDVQISVDGHAFTTLMSGTTALSTVRTLTYGHAYQLRVRATDGAANTGAWAIGPNFRANAVQDGAVAYHGVWTLITTSAAVGSGYHQTTQAFATATYSFIGRNIAWVATTGVSGGKAAVYVDGHYIATIYLHATTTRYRQLVFARTLTYGSHSIVIRDLGGTVGHTRVTLDELIALR
jgi:hypothetical protein